MKIQRKHVPLFLCGILLLIPQNVYASTKSTGRLTDLFQTQAFSGSMETISKMNWVGWLLSGIISVFCLVGLFLTIFRIMTSLMYLSGRNVFDKIHEIKTSNQGEWFGLKSLLSSTFHGGGNTGSGVDTFIYFFLGLLPDVKMYSDFADGKEMKGVGPDTTVTEYILKTSIPTIMMIFFLSIGFSGTLWQMYGTVVDAMSTAAEKFASTNLDSQVNRLLNADSYYKFGYGDDGTKWGKLKENIATGIYNKVLSKSDDSIDGDYSLALGATIGNYFKKGAALDATGIATKCGNKAWANDDAEAKNVQYSVLVNSIKDSADSHDFVIPFSTLRKNLKSNVSTQIGTRTSDTLYIHVYLYRKESAIKTNYFTVKSKGDDAIQNKGNGTLDNKNGASGAKTSSSSSSSSKSTTSNPFE